MANANTIKQRFMDILFESDDEDKIDENIQKTTIKESEHTIKASDLLYGKKQNRESSPFINLDEKKEEKVETKVTKPTEIDDIYIPTGNLSPIFGNIDEPKKKTNKSNISTAVNYASTKKPTNSYLGTVISPIYGYDSIGADKARESLLKEKEEETKNSIIDDFDDIFSSEEYKQNYREEDKVEKFDTGEIDLFADIFKEGDK